jgi:hypothetical protein
MKPRVERTTIRGYCVGMPPCARLGLAVRRGEPGDAGGGGPHLRRSPPRSPQLSLTK